MVEIGRRSTAPARLALVPLLAWIGIGLALPVAGAEGWVKSYKKGVEAIDREDWNLAVERLRRAVEDHPQESERAPRLMFRRYIPYYYLGVAWYELGNCDEALKALEESALQGVVSGMPEGYDLDRKRRQCQARSDRSDALSRARASIERATTASAAVAELQRHPELNAVWEWREDSLGKRQKRAEALLEEARAILARNPEGLSTGQLKEAGEKAAQARWQLEAIRVEATQHLSEVRSLLEKKRSDLAGLISEARRQEAAAAALKPMPSGLALRLADLDRAIRRAGETRNSTAVDDLVAAETSLRDAIEALRSAISPPPRILQEAADAYFNGEYRRAAELLTEVRVAGGRARAHLYLLRSAAHYALFRTAGDDPEVLGRAREDARLCRRQDAAVKPSATLFSPGFVEFFGLQSTVDLKP